MRPEEHLWVEKYRPNTIAECALPESMKNFFSAMVKKGNIQNLMLIGGAGMGKCLDGSEIVEISGSKDFLDSLYRFVQTKKVPTNFKDLFYENRANFLSIGVFSDSVPDKYVNWDAVEHLYKNPGKLVRQWKPHMLRTIFRGLPDRDSMEFLWLMETPFSVYIEKRTKNKAISPKWDFRKVNHINPDAAWKLMEDYYNRRATPQFSSNIRDDEYWLSRGWSKDEIEKKKAACVVSLWTTNYWTSRGFSEADAKKHVSKIQTENSRKSVNKTDRSSRIRCLEFWLKKTNGNEMEARKLLSNHQATFSLKKCIEKYGEVVGREKWLDRQVRWQRTLQANPNIDEINKRKDSVSYEFHLKKYGNTAADAHRKRLESIITPRFSMESLKYFLPIISWAENNAVECLYGANELSLYCTKTNKIKLYDLSFPSLGVIIDYHGVGFHARPGDTAWRGACGLTYKDTIAKDLDSKRIAEDNGYEYIVVWSDNLPKQEDIVEKLNALL